MTILRKLLQGQKGAMFGMDARVALIIASVLAATGGVTVMSKIERNRVEASERGVSMLKDAIISYYETIDLDAMPPDIATLFSSGVIEEGILSVDPWGNSWEYNIVSDTSKSIEDVPVTIFYITIHSSGKDATDNSVAISNIAEYTSWTTGGDDIGLKFNTVEIEKKRVSAYQTMGKTVVNALNVYESSKYLEADNLCTTTPADPDCTNSGKSYTQYNYYPESNPQGNGGGGSAVYYNNVTSTATAFTSANLVDMQALMTELDLPTSYASDPWGRVLNYESNATGRNESPFSASVWYQ